MDDAATLEAVALECGNGLRVGAAHVQEGRQCEFGGQLQLFFEQHLLVLAVELLQEVVQAELADSTELRMAGQALEPVAQLTQVFRRMLLQINRVQAEGGV